MTFCFKSCAACTTFSGRAEIAPIIFIGAKGEDFFSLGSETQIGGDDGESALFSHHRKKARRNNVDAGKSQRLQLLCKLEPIQSF